MVVAVQWDAGGRVFRGRVSWWRRQDGVWWGFVMAEPAESRAGVEAGWMDAERLRPGVHEVRTTHTRGRWAVWSPPVWPAELERFATATWNEAESRPRG